MDDAGRRRMRSSMGRHYPPLTTANHRSAMNPTPHKTKLERAEELDVAAKFAHNKQDYAFAATLASHARLLREQDHKERQHDSDRTARKA